MAGAMTTTQVIVQSGRPSRAASVVRPGAAGPGEVRVAGAGRLAAGRRVLPFARGLAPFPLGAGAAGAADAWSAGLPGVCAAGAAPRPVVPVSVPVPASARVSPGLSAGPRPGVGSSAPVCLPDTALPFFADRTSTRPRSIGGVSFQVRVLPRRLITNAAACHGAAHGRGPAPTSFPPGGYKFSPRSFRLSEWDALAATLAHLRGYGMTRAYGAGSRPGLLRLEADAGVEANYFGVHIVVGYQGANEVGELVGAAHALGEDDGSAEPGLEVRGALARTVDGGVDDAGADRVHADADGREVPGGGHGHPDDAALGRGIGDLAGLALDPGHGRGVDDHATLAVRVGRLGPGHRGRRQPGQVERPDQVDRDDLLVGGQVVRAAVTGHGARGPGDTRAAHSGPQRPAAGRGGGHGRLYRRLVGHVGAGEHAADVIRDGLAAILAEVGDDDEGASGGEAPCGRLTEPAGTAGHDCGGSVQFHGREDT